MQGTKFKGDNFPDWKRIKTAHLKIVEICKKLGIKFSFLNTSFCIDQPCVSDVLIEQIKIRESKRRGFKSMLISPNGAQL